VPAVAGKHDPFDQLLVRREVFEDLQIGVAHPQKARVFERCL
jgi:hypothetical protein